MPTYMYTGGKPKWKPMGQTWVERGYAVRTETMLTPPDDCVVCGTPKNLCTGETHQAMAAQSKQRDAVRRVQAAQLRQTPVRPDPDPEPNQKAPENPADIDAVGRMDPDAVPTTPVVSDRPAGAPRDGRVLLIGEPLMFDAEERAGGVYVTENVYRQHRVRNSKSVTYVLVYTKGQQIPMSVVQKVKNEQQANEEKQQREGENNGLNPDENKSVDRDTIETK